MAQRWRVFKDNQDLGLMTSAEIRQALRDGVVDPFDLVSREGSSLKVELVEVDEIFDPRYQEAAEPVASPVPQQQVRPNMQAAPVAVNAPQPNAPYVPSPLEAITSSSFAAGPGGETTATGRKRRAAMKKFYLVDRRGRVLGPLSAGEIQSLYQRGIVEKGVRVQKVGEPKSIPLNLFISAYAGERMQALGASNNDIRQAPGVTAMKSSKVLNELYLSVSTGGAGKKGLTPYLGVLLVGVFLGLLVFFSLNFDDQDGRKRTVSRERATRERGSPTLKRIPERARRQIVRQSERERPEIQRKREVAASREVAPSRPVTSPRPQPPVASTPRPAPRTPPSRAPASVPALRDGEVATLSNLEFSKVDLEDCPLKCRLPFFSGGRRVVTAVFFKGAFEDKLQATRGRVTIRGNVKREDDGFILFLQDVR